MLDLKLRFHESCPKHPCYQPQQGQGAIIGGCIYCTGLFHVWHSMLKLSQAITEFQQLMDRYQAKQVRSVPKEIKSEQPTLFHMGGR